MDSIAKNQITWDFISADSIVAGADFQYIQIGDVDILDKTDKWNTNFEKYLDRVFLNTYSFRYLKENTRGDRKILLPAIYLRLAVDSICRDEFKIVFSIYKDNELLQKIERTYIPTESSIANPDFPRLQVMNNPDVSYALLRTNPKLTGNVKIVVDSKDDIYLDTFKVSQTLSQKKYRHIKVSSTDYYGQNLMSKFKNVPVTDFYKVEDKCYSLFTPAQTYSGEYYDMYRMGAKTNDDKMYSENYSIFAPICLKTYTPDFFVVFKVDKDTVSDGNFVYDEESMDDISKLEYFIKHGTVVKSYDMREGSKLGDYIKTIVERSSSAPGDLYESYDTGNSNKYIGISLDRGVVTSIYESVYPEESLNNQVALNEYYTKGFERGHIVSRNIVNLEFMFDDPDAELFSLNTYFGLYIKVNSSGNAYSCIGTSSDGNIFDRELVTFGPESDIMKDLEKPVIYGLTTPDKFVRLNDNVYKSKEVSEYALKPYKNVLSSRVYTDTAGHVISLKLNKPFTTGDHIRIILPDSKRVYEILCSNTSSYHDEYFCSEPIMNIFYSDGESWNIHRVSLFMSDDIDSENIDINDSIKCGRAVSLTRDRIVNGFKKMFDNTVACFSLGESGIGIKINETGYFERICAPSGFDSTQAEYILETDDEDKSIEFFRGIYPEKVILNTDTELSSKQYFYPVNFEIVGSRMAYIMKFINIPDTVYYGEVPDIDVFNAKTLLFKQAGEDAGYTQYKDINISYIINDGAEFSEKTVPGVKTIPFYKNGNYMIFNVSNPKITNGNILIYSCCPINDGVCSIFNIKDFDFDVLDSDSVISFSENINGSETQIGNQGEYSNNSVFGNSIKISSEESIYDYIDKRRTITYNAEDPDDKLRNILKLYYNANHKSFDISVYSPYICKWKSVGTDSRGENLRLMYDYDGLDGKSYYVSGSDTYSNYLGYLYNTSKDRINVGKEKYIKNALSDVVSSSDPLYVKNALLETAVSIDDIVYDSTDYGSKYSVAYISGDNTLEFISAGIKFKIKSTNDNAINLNNYNGYSAIFISFPDINQFGTTDTEIIIDEVKREIMVCWYQGSVSLEYGADIPDAEPVSDFLTTGRSKSLYKMIMPTPFDFDDFTPGYAFNKDSNPIRIGKYSDIDGFGNKNEKFCDKNGLVVFSNTGTDETDFMKYSSLILYGKLYSQLENTVNPSEKEYYYSNQDKITLVEPYLFYDSSWGYTTSEVYDLKLGNHKSCTQRILFTDDKKYITNRIGTFADLNESLSNHSVYVKTVEGKKDYTNLKGIIEMSAVEPVLYIKNRMSSDRRELGYVHSTYAEPVMRDMLVFDYTSADTIEIGKNFGLCTDGSNITVKDVNKIPQLWINKYSTDPNYCGDATASVSNLRTSIDVIHNKSIFDSAWKKSLYRRYYIENIEDSSISYEKYENVDGYITGYEQKNFFNSRGTQLKRFDTATRTLGLQTFDIVSWKNSSISHTRNYIRIDISDSIIYKLLNDSNFIKAWDYLKLSSNNYKINYIKKTILPLININNKTKLILKRNNVMLDRFNFVQEFDETMTDVTNYKNTLKYENGKYYMYIYPEDNYTYSAKMIVDL